LISEGDLLRPSLRRYPDARRAAAPQIDPLLLPYAALMLGSAVAGVLAFYNAIVIRRFGNALLALLLGAAGWICCVLMVAAANDARVENVGFVLLGVRVVHFVIGGILFFLQRPHVHGNVFLRGDVAPTRASYFAALAIAWFLPIRIVLVLLGVPPGR
jgi:hypothetical protein